jgi:hypothetical protein
MYCFQNFLYNVGETEFPILIWLINVFEEALSLFFRRKVKEKCDDSRSVTVEMVFQVYDGAISPLDKRFSRRAYRPVIAG